MVFTGKNVTAFQKTVNRLAVGDKACVARCIVQKLQQRQHGTNVRKQSWARLKETRQVVDYESKVRRSIFYPRSHRHLCFPFMLNANKTFYHVLTNLRMSCSNPLLKMLFCNIGSVRLILFRKKNTHKSLQVHFVGQNIFSVYLLIRSSELALIELQMHLLIKLSRSVI